MKRTPTLALAGLVLLVAALVGAATAQAAVDEGAARHTPWSGYWWPIAKGELLGPLQKYDYLTGAAAMQWERTTHPPGPGVPEWHGYCHAWSASAVLEKEPKGPRRPPSQGSRALTLGVGDQKGLLAVSHARDVANHYGDRFGDGEGSEDYQDLDPCTLWQILRTYLKEQGVPMVMDLEAGPEVWNYPVFAYRIEYSPAGPPGQQVGRLALWAADDAVPPDYVGIMLHYQTYTFTFQVRNGSIVMGSGRWVGESVQNHPDFAWYPYVVMPENPQIDYRRVKQIVGVASANSTTGSRPDSGSGSRPTGRPNTGSGASSGTSSSSNPGLRPNTIPGTIAGGQPGAGPGASGPSGGTAFGALPQNATCLSPLEMVATIAEKTSGFGLDVTVDRFDGGQYAVGDPLQLRGSSERAGYLYVFYLDSQGNPTLFYPQPGQDNRIAAGRPFIVPGPDDPVFRVRGPFGVHRMKAVVTSRPLMLTGLVSPGLAQQQQQQQQAGAGYKPCEFRWYPSQQKQVQGLLKKYEEQKSLDAKDLDGIKAPQIFASFAQDEVAFYVGPRQN